MKVIENKFELEMDRWDDPGDYPSGAGAGPLPSYNYIAGCPGRLVLELEAGDEIPDNDEDEEQLALEHADLPRGVRVTQWNCTRNENKLTFEVEECEGDGDEPDGYDD